jgi:hypothetical protein
VTSITVVLAVLIQTYVMTAMADTPAMTARLYSVPLVTVRLAVSNLICVLSVIPGIQAHSVAHPR